MVTIAPFPSNSKDIIEKIITQVGRPVTFYTVVSVSGCYLCAYDPISDTSTDSFCPVCSGEFWIPTYSGSVFTSKVTWGMSEYNDWVTGGHVENGDCELTLLYAPETETIVHDAKYVVVDDRKLNLKKIILRGIKPTYNRILVVLKEKELG